MKQIVILGSGGNCIDILDTINEINLNGPAPRYSCIGFLDDSDDAQHKSFYGIKVIGKLGDASKFKDAYFVNGIGSPNNFWKKKEIIEKAAISLDRFETIIHPSAVVSKLAVIGNGTVIFQNVVITSNVKVGSHVIILPNSVISHDDVIGDYTCIAGGVCISGGVTVGSHCYLGTNSSFIGNITIGNNSMIGMGSTVLKDVEANSMMVGNPAKFLRKVIS